MLETEVLPPPTLEMEVLSPPLMTAAAATSLVVENLLSSVVPDGNDQKHRPKTGGGCSSDVAHEQIKTVEASVGSSVGASH